MKLKEYSEYSPEELKQARAHMLTELEYPWRTGRSLPKSQSEYTKPHTKASKDFPTIPIYIDPDLMEDRAYQRLSIVGKLAWFTLIHGRKQFLMVAEALPTGKYPDYMKPNDLDQTILVGSMSSIMGHVLRGKELYEAVDELKDAGLIEVDEEGQFNFCRYVTFEEPKEGTIKDIANE